MKEMLIFVEIKCQLDATDEFLLQILMLAQHVSVTIMPIIRSSRVLYRWLLPVVFGALVFKLSVWCGAEGCVSGLLAANRTMHGQNHFKSNLSFLLCFINPEYFGDVRLRSIILGFRKLLITKLR
jgi:hypothetical protein